ncbi:MAG TPA: HD domain-containing protein [Candidatus Thermoplasmatota archaeon]|nr:HD domain-containing protein [Candidatus Thermoplasmatota archaeon]
MVDIYQYDKKKEEQTIIKTDTGKRKKEQYIENLREGDAINDFFAVKIKKAQRPYKRGMFFEFLATDKTGEISVKFWGGDNKDRVKRLYESFNTGDVVQVRTGMVENYEDRLQISVNENTGGVRKCAPNEYDVTDFLPALSEERIVELYETVKKELKTIQNEPLKNLLASFFDDPEFVTMYMHSPSAISHHHNYVGGNLEHTVGVVRLCKNITEMYPNVNKDLLLCGALLHDIGKLKEYTYAAAIDISDEGNFIGHIVIGEQWIREKIQGLKASGKEFSKELENQVVHLILSHHGKYEWGSPKIPKLVEACILHQADLMDSRVKNYLQMIEDAKKQTDEEWTFIYDADVGKRRAIFLGQY